jgi:hypothetical protein
MDFLKKVFGDDEGYLVLVTISGGKRESHSFEYPGGIASITEQVDEWSKKSGTNVYFYPALYDQESTESTVISSPVIAADLDMLSPVLVSPRPDLVVESSSGRYQAYWYRNGFKDEFSPLSVNGPIASDNRLRRLPGTKNWKYSSEPWLVQEIESSDLDTFLKVTKRRELSGETFDYLFRVNDRWSLARMCARLGCTTQETYLVLEASQSAVGALPGDDRYAPLSVLFKDATDSVASSSVPSLLTEDEIRSTDLGLDKDSFVDRYVEWATQCTDSPSQYHIAGALMALSVLLSPHIRLPTSFGEFRCNLWFMILAGTTLTRKTTAMEMSVKLAKCIDPDIVLSTKGSSEGITSALADRNGKSSLFHRDEISGFLSETVDKKYMSGFLEDLTRLYDGGEEKRTLRSKVIEVNNPYFQILCGGIKSKTTELLTAEHINSGFLPRFLIVCGWTRIEDMKPIGPPDQGTTELRDSLLKYLSGLSNRYTTTSSPFSSNGNAEPLLMKATQEAWERMRKLEEDVHHLGTNSENPDIFTPLYERCMNSIIKVAILLSADRAYRENLEPMLDIQDLVKAISYSGVWIESMYEVARGIEDKPGKDEVRVLRIEKHIRESKDGLNRGAIMRRFRLTAREASEIEATLIGRGLVIAAKVGRGTVYRAATREE